MPLSETSLAFCISGQIRGSRAHLEEVAEFARRYEADVFLSVWAKWGRKTLSGATGPGQINRLMGPRMTFMMPVAFLHNLEQIFDGVQRQFNAPTTDVAEDLAELFPEAVLDIEDDTIDLDLVASTDTNSLRMLYRIWRCNKLKRRAETRRARRYETVVRFRPDTIPDGPLECYLSSQGIEKFAMLPAAWGGQNQLNDTYWICGSEHDDYLASLFGKAVLSPHRCWRGIHHELYEHASRGAFSLRLLKSKRGELPGAMPDDMARDRQLVADALEQGTCNLPEGFSPEQAAQIARLMRYASSDAPPDEAFSTAREILQATRDVSVLKAALMIAMDSAQEAEPRERCYATLVAFTLLAIECGVRSFSWKIPGVPIFVETWAENLSHIDDALHELRPFDPTRFEGSTLAQMARLALLTMVKEIGADALSEIFTNVVSYVDRNHAVAPSRADCRGARHPTTKNQSRP